MTRQTLDPQDFSERLDRAFGSEPPHPSLVEDLRLGKRRLRRRRAAAAVSGLAVAAVAAGAVTLGPAALPRQTEPAPAAGPLTAAEIVDRCTTGENASFIHRGGSKQELEAVRLLGDLPKLMSSAVAAHRTQAALLSRDGKYWGKCQFRNQPDNGVKNTMSVYSTDVLFPPAKVAGVDAYEPVDDADPRLAANVDPPLPQFELTCPSGYDGEDNFAVEAQCAEFTMHWTDRRPAEVAAVRVTTPDGVSSWADVKQGFLSFAYTGTMTPEIAERVARGENPGAQRVVFYDEDGNVLVDDRDPGHVPGKGELSILNFPSLAWWLT